MSDMFFNNIQNNPRFVARLFSEDDIFPHMSLLKLDASYFLDLIGDTTDDIIIGEGTRIGENVVIEGPVIIGDNCTIMPHAHSSIYSDRR